jgi:small subunit ribosomal protein S6e
VPLLIVSDPKTGKSQKVELEDSRMSPLLGKRIGEVVEGSVAGLQGKLLKITGGTDKDGVPMRPDVHGSAKAFIILSGGVGYKAANRGERKRKLVRGNIVSADSKFLDLMVVEEDKSLKKAVEAVKVKKAKRLAKAEEVAEAEKPAEPEEAKKVKKTKKAEKTLKAEKPKKAAKKSTKASATKERKTK